MTVGETGLNESIVERTRADNFYMKSKKISNDQELIQSDPISCPQNQKGVKYKKCKILTDLF